MALKWILEDSTIKFGNVEYHRDLKGNGHVNGGGMFIRRSYLDGTITYLLYGESQDFGTITENEFLTTTKFSLPFRDSYKQVSIKFSTALHLEDAMRENNEEKTKEIKICI